MGYNSGRAYSYSSINDGQMGAAGGGGGGGSNDGDGRSGCCGRRRPSTSRGGEESPGGDADKGCCGACCSGCMGRMPFATLIATLICIAGVGVFLGAMDKALILTIKMFDTVFHYKMLAASPTRLVSLQDIPIVFIAIGSAMAVLALLVLLVGCLSTGSTRSSVYKNWKVRAGGRFTCSFLMIVTYVLKLVWLLITLIMTVLCFVMYVWTGVCNGLQKLQQGDDERCIDLRQFSFLLPDETKDHQHICDPGVRKTFCVDYVRNATLMYYIATAGAVAVLLSLVHYLMCLSANYTRIKDQAKIQDLEILKELEENEMGPLGGGKTSSANRY